MVFVKKATGIVLVSLLFFCNGSSLVGVHAEGSPEGSEHNETTAPNEQSLKTLTSSDEFLEDLSADDGATKKTTASTEASATTESAAAKNESEKSRRQSLPVLKRQRHRRKKRQILLLNRRKLSQLVCRQWVKEQQKARVLSKMKVN